MSIVPQTAQWYEEEASGAEVALGRITLRGDGWHVFAASGTAAAYLTQRTDEWYKVDPAASSGLPLYVYGTTIEVHT